MLSFRHSGKSCSLLLGSLALDNQWLALDVFWRIGALQNGLLTALGRWLILGLICPIVLRFINQAPQAGTLSKSWDVTIWANLQGPALGVLIVHRLARNLGDAQWAWFFYIFIL